MQSPKAIVYSIEADEKNYNVLLQNLGPEIQNQQVIPIHAALADRNEPIYLQRSTFSYNTRVSASPTDLAVNGIKMETFLKQYSITTIDILKIDIEGAESFLFSADVSWLQHVKNILIELHSDAIAKQFEKAVFQYDFRIEKRVSNHENVYWAYKPSIDVYAS